MKTKIKSLEDEKTQEKTFKSNEMVEVVDIEVIELQYLYQDGDFAYFMDERSFEQYSLSKKAIRNILNYLKEGQKLSVLLNQNEPLAVRAPQTVKLKVTKAQEAVKGDTAMTAKKMVTVETGVKVSVPLFIRQGDIISVNPQTGEYIERVTKAG